MSSKKSLAKKGAKAASDSAGQPGKPKKESVAQTKQKQAVGPKVQ